MQTHLLRTLALAAMLLVGGMAATAQTSKAKAGIVRVKLQQSVARDMGKQIRKAPKGKTLSTGIDPIDVSLRNIKGVSIRPVFPCPAGKEAEYAAFGLDQWYEITFDESVKPLEARSVMRQTPGVVDATVKVPMKLFDNGSARIAKAAPQRAQTTMPFNDPRLSAQWHYNNPGTMAGSIAGADINLFEAWKLSTGSPSVVVAVIDGGIDIAHEDLSSHIWVNPGEIPGNGIDDDGNGYVDDVNGFNFCTHEGLIAAHQHGTHVAGTISAVNNNGIGVAGVAGGDGSPDSGVRLMSVQVFDSRSGTPQADFAAAIVYAANMGATIANCSWGWDEDGYYEQDVVDAVRYFTRSARSANMVGGLLIFAAGNNAETGAFYPQCMDEVLTVAAMTHNMQVANYSNYGDWVDVIAPGGLLDFDTREGVLSTLPDNNYGYLEGTSMAAPHVTGIAALFLSEHGSPTLTSDALRTQISTSIDDFYAYNDGLPHLYGSGNVNAQKVLMWSEGSVPEIPTNITILPAQDNVTITWTVPASADNNVHHHNIYYSTSRFNDRSDLTAIPSVAVDTKFNSSGDIVTYELTGLAPLTTYYIAVQAVNRWGGASPISEVIEVSTNSGPKMTVDASSLYISARPGSSASEQFTIGNDDEGLLKWSAKVRTRSFPMSLFSTPLQKSSPYSGTLGFEQAPAQASVVSISDYELDDYPTTITTTDYINAFIGDVDKRLPNSLAQCFTVDKDKYPEGFNLTHVYLMGSNGDEPVIEVYSGNRAINEQTLLLSFEPSQFMYYSDISLPEQLYFAPGESFYIVYHFKPQDALYPLGMGKSNGASTATQAYLSNDLGKTWTLLSQALKGSKYEEIADRATWAVYAVSQNPDVAKAFVLTPDNGMVAQGEKQTVTVGVDTSKLINGTYGANIHFSTNESETNNIMLPVTINVAGQKPDITFTRIVDFGSLLVGQTKNITVEFFNRGYGDFRGEYGPLQSSDIQSTNPCFSTPSLHSAFGARRTSRVEITYTPTEAGSHSGQIIFTNADGQHLTITVQGVATDPAVIRVEPAQGVDVGEIEVGGSHKTAQFEIHNDGSYPLQFVMPRYTTEVLEGVSSDKTHKFGYTWVSNLNGATDVEYSPAPQLKKGVNVARQFSDDVYWTKAIDLGFDFPYFGETYDKIYISSFGGVAFFPYEEGMMWAPLYENNYAVAGTGLISMFGNSELVMTPSSVVEYAKQDDRFYINYRNVMATVYDKDYTPISFHMVLDPSGDIEMYYDDFTPSKLFQDCEGLYVALNDVAMADPLIVTSVRKAHDGNKLYQSFGTGTAVKFMAPRSSMVRTVEPAIGVVSPGMSTTVTATLEADSEMSAGPTYTDLVVLSNDPASPQTLVRFNALVTGDLNPVLAITTPTVDFGDVFRTAEAESEVIIKNTGRAPLNVTKVALTGDAFSINFATPVVIPPGQSRSVPVVLNTSVEGTYNGSVAIESDGGNRTVALTATVIGCPEVNLSYTSLTQTLAYGKSVAKPLKITNSGDADLTYSIVAGSHIDYKPLFGDNCRVSYDFVSSVDTPDARENWVDVESNGLGEHLDIDYFANHDFVAVDLPFEFPFYDNKYRRMYVYNSGFVSFTERRDDKIWPEPPAEFPAGSIYTNVIAPYWGLHSMDTSPGAGIYYYVADNYAVVSYMEYGNSMNVGVDFQVVIRKDGTFTFNYKGANDNATIFSLFGVAGISNIDGSEGVDLPARTVRFGNSTTFSPIVENVLPAGESVDADITLVADRMAGTYNSSIKVLSNAPGLKEANIPVRLTVTGSPRPVFPEDRVSEHVRGYQEISTDDYFLMNGAMYYEKFVIKNEGSAPFTITSIDVDCPAINTAHGPMPYFTLYTYGNYRDEIEMQEGTGWHPYSGESWVVTTDSVQLAVPMMPGSGGGIAYVPGEYTCTISMRVTGVSGVRTKSFDVIFRVTEAPELTLDKEEVHIYNAADGLVKDETITLGNVGQYDLRYEYYLDITGAGFGMTADDDTGAIMPMSLDKLPGAPKPMDTGNNGNYLDVPTEGEYTNYLYWPASLSAVNAYTYGSTTTYSEYKAATCYEGPEGGFNAAELYFMYCPYNLGGKTIRVEIVNGDAWSGDVLSYGTFTVPTGTYQEGQLTLAIARFNRPVYISEGQKIYVVITYPEGSPYPAALISKKERNTENRYLGYADNFGTWFDIGAAFESQVGSVGYVMTLLERTPGSKWVRLLDDVNAGTLAVGETAQIRLQINADSAPKDTGNKAVIVIRTNDPERPVINFPVYLDRNAAPTITCDTPSLVVNESETAEVTMHVRDMDGDTFAVMVLDLHPDNISTVKSVTPSDPADTEAKIDAIQIAGPNNYPTTYLVSDAPGGVDVTVQVAPGYGDAGTFMFTLYAQDINDHQSEMSVLYAVNHKNRAPEPLDYDDIYVKYGYTTGPIYFTAFFDDPDGDEMTYEVEVNALSYHNLEIFRGEKSFIVHGLRRGKQLLNITATDSNGASTTIVVNVFVGNDDDGIEDIEMLAGVTAYPNPVAEMLHVSLETPSNEVVYELYTAAGALVHVDRTNAQLGEPHTIPVASLPTGTYLLRVTADGRSATKVIVKE